MYCVNFDQSRIDVLDSRVYNSEGDASWDMYHSSMGKTIMQRLSDALSKAAPHKFPSFRNWRHVQVVVPLQKCPTDDPFFAMKFLEFYDGDGHGSLKCTIDGVSHSIHFHWLGAFISYFLLWKLFYDRIDQKSCVLRCCTISLITRRTRCRCQMIFFRSVSPITILFSISIAFYLCQCFLFGYLISFLFFSKQQSSLASLVVLVCSILPSAVFSNHPM